MERSEGRERFVQGTVTAAGQLTAEAEGIWVELEIRSSSRSFLTPGASFEYTDIGALR